MKTLAEAFSLEQQRVRDLLQMYESIPSGVFGAAMLRHALVRAEKAAAAGDVVEMLAAYHDLQQCQ